MSHNSFSYLSPRRQSSYASISGSGSFDDLGSTSSSSGIGGIASRFATLRATRRKDGREALSVKDVPAMSRDSRRHMIAVCVLTSVVCCTICWMLCWQLDVVGVLAVLLWLPCHLWNMKHYNFCRFVFSSQLSAPSLTWFSQKTYFAARCGFAGIDRTNAIQFLKMPIKRN